MAVEREWAERLPSFLECPSRPASAPPHRTGPPVAAKGRGPRGRGHGTLAVTGGAGTQAQGSRAAGDGMKEDGAGGTFSSPLSHLHSPFLRGCRRHVVECSGLCAEPHLSWGRGANSRVRGLSRWSRETYTCPGGCVSTPGDLLVLDPRGRGHCRVSSVLAHSSRWLCGPSPWEAR